MSNNQKKGLEALLRPEHSIVVLIDHQLGASRYSCPISRLDDRALRSNRRSLCLGAAIVKYPCNGVIIINTVKETS